MGTLQRSGHVCVGTLLHLGPMWKAYRVCISYVVLIDAYICIHQTLAFKLIYYAREVDVECYEFVLHLGPVWYWAKMQRG